MVDWRKKKGLQDKNFVSAFLHKGFRNTVYNLFGILAAFLKLHGLIKMPAQKGKRLKYVNFLSMYKKIQQLPKFL